MTTLRAARRHPQFRAGMADMAGVSLGIAAWGLVTGVAMVKSGLSVPLALFMSLAVFAGSAQLAVVPLMALGAPMGVIWATALCVNLRFVIFSAQWRPYFRRLPLRRRLLMGYFTGDLNYVVFMKRFREPRDDEGQIEYFLGGALVCWLAWQLPSIAGIVLADVIPTQWGLGFAGVLALLGLAYSMLSDRATTLAAAVAGAAAVAAFALPLRLYIVVAIAAAVCMGLLIDGSGDAGRRVRQLLSADSARRRADAGGTREGTA
ncbi:MAG TPA: AzlC family ABC transporter permease [Albitalea sp.]|nr:AzlC family ABC transporter permease [Albitalea sp.]